jgi:hypothetical protein
MAMPALIPHDCYPSGATPAGCVICAVCHACTLDDVVGGRVVTFFGLTGKVSSVLRLPDGMRWSTIILNGVPFGTLTLPVPPGLAR